MKYFYDRIPSATEVIQEWEKNDQQLPPFAAMLGIGDVVAYFTMKLFVYIKQGKEILDVDKACQWIEDKKQRAEAQKTIKNAIRLFKGDVNR